MYTQLNQKEILEMLKERGIKVNEHKLRIILPAMVDDEQLDSYHGNGNATYYILPTQPRKTDTPI